MDTDPWAQLYIVATPVPNGEREVVLLLVEGSNRGLVAMEPAGCNHTLSDPTSAATSVYSDAKIAKLAKVPILVVFGDHLDAPQTYGVTW